MIDRVTEVYKTRGLEGLLTKGVNFILARTLGLRISKSISINSHGIARRIFSPCSIQESEDGYFYLDPMPTEAQLAEYYSSLYWGSRDGKDYGASVRDLVHYDLLRTYAAEEMTAGKVFLNFGAGHGGISNLCWFVGMDVVNVEPSGVPGFYEQRWTTYQSISEVESDSVDVVYGSHSLEHVQDIGRFKKEVERVLKSKGLLFWEVPNADAPWNGAQKGKVDIPHTYYFKADFFNKWFTETILCKGYVQTHGFDVIERWAEFENSEGAVVRALGRIEKVT